MYNPIKYLKMDISILDVLRMVTLPLVIDLPHKDKLKWSQNENWIEPMHQYLLIV